MSEFDLIKFVEFVLVNVVKMKCCKFVCVKDIVKGNVKLNLVFVCNLFNNYFVLELVEEELFNFEEICEEKIFCNWMNSMGVKFFV